MVPRSLLGLSMNTKIAACSLAKLIAYGHSGHSGRLAKLRAAREEPNGERVNSKSKLSKMGDHVLVILCKPKYV